MTVAAILLAAGQSRRMGTCKQLLPLGTTTVIGRCLATLRAGGITDIVVVVEPAGEAVAREAGRVDGVRIVVNREAGGDMASSVRAGRALLGPDTGGVLVALCDYPLVRAATIEQLVRRYREHGAPIIIPSHDGRNGHPLLVSRAILEGLGAEMTLRDLVRQEAGQAVTLPVDDAGVLLDMDTPEAYREVRSRIAHAS